MRFQFKKLITEGLRVWFSPIFRKMDSFISNQIYIILNFHICFHLFFFSKKTIYLSITEINCVTHDMTCHDFSKNTCITCLISHIVSQPNQNHINFNFSKSKPKTHETNTPGTVNKPQIKRFVSWVAIT